MAKYLATLKRTVTQIALVDIEADSREEAEREAQSRAENGDGLMWSELFKGSGAPWVDELEAQEPDGIDE